MSVKLSLESRVRELEIKSAHQELTIQDLSDGISKQWNIIDKLTRSVKLFESQILNLRAGSIRSSIDKPPHY
jgi:SlyX protein